MALLLTQPRKEQWGWNLELIGKGGGEFDKILKRGVVGNIDGVS